MLGLGLAQHKSINRWLAWTPEKTTTSLWFDMSDTSTITASGGAVSQLNDKSGNNRHLTQSSESNKPTTDANTINNLNIFDFDGGDWLLRIDSNVGNIVNGTNKDFMVFGIMETSVDSAEQRFLSLGNTALFQNTYQIGVLYNEDEFRNIVWNSAGSPYYIDGVFEVVDSPFILNGGFNGSDTKLYLNGTEYTGGGVSGQFGTIAGADRITVGISEDQSGAPLTGKIGEVIVLDSWVGETIRQKTEGYLAHKWGLTSSLPAGHPYKNSPPRL